MMGHPIWIAVGLAALGAAPAGPQPPVAVTVQLSNFKFAPRTILLEQGRPYVLRLYNAAGGGHDFTARDFFAAATIAAGDRGKIRDGTVEVPPGEWRSIPLTAPGPGRYRLKCTHRFHKALGMTGTIVVR